jgi:hypothetical protein
MGRRPIGKVAMTGAERTRLYRRRHPTDKPSPKASADDGVLQKELAQAKARMHGLEGEVAALKAELALSVGGRFALQQRSKPKAEKPPLPPDEERDRQIKGLKTRVQNLRSQLHAEREWHRHKADGSMSFQTMSAISKALHPDADPGKTERDQAYKLFTAWKADRDKARRQTGS